MDEMYYDDRNIRKSIKDIYTCIVILFALWAMLCIIVSVLPFSAKNTEYGEVKIEIKPAPITTIIGGLDSLAQCEVNDQLALLLMRDLKVQHPHIVLAQMKLESAHYQSKLAKENNNYFGMKHPRQRLTMSIGEKNGYAHFRSWPYSILDYALWQKRYAYNLDEQEYLKKIGGVYAEDEEYIIKLQNLMKK